MSQRGSLEIEREYRTCTWHAGRSDSGVQPVIALVYYSTCRPSSMRNSVAQARIFPEMEVFPHILGNSLEVEKRSSRVCRQRIRFRGRVVFVRLQVRCRGRIPEAVCFGFVMRLL